MIDLRTTKGTETERTVLDDAVLAEFRASLRGALLLPSDAEYEAARQVWNGLIDWRPALIVRCAGTADVINAVNWPAAVCFFYRCGDADFCYIFAYSMRYRTLAID